MPWDAIIVGGGAMGTAAAMHLAARGRRVVLFERFDLAHDRGSSHGLSRIIRLAYFEHPAYVPLLRRAFELWRQLEESAGEPLLEVTGGLDIGRQDGVVFQGALRSCREHTLAHEVLSARMLSERFPAWSATDNLHAVFQPDAGILHPERAVLAHASRARNLGAEIRVGERVLDWQAGSGRVSVSTERGTYEAGQLVLTAGSWMGSLCPALAPLLAPERQAVGWFETTTSRLFAPDRFPVFVLDAPEGLFYGFPEHGVPGFKIGKYHHRGERTDPDNVDRAWHDADERALREGIARYLPSANGALLRHSTCLFTNTPDGHFIVDRDPAAPEVLLVAPCSGHGFKFASVIGEIVADLVQAGHTPHDISLFRLDRFRVEGR